MANQRVFWLLRVTILITVLVFFVAWLGTGQTLVSSVMDYSGDALLETADVIQESLGYRIIATAVGLFPMASCYVLLYIRMVSSSVFFVVAAGHWFLHFHSLQSAATMSEFLTSPLPIGEQTELTLLDLNEAEFDALLDWSLCRREAVQNRLLPTTLILAFLGVLANTSLGESVGQLALSITRDYFRDVGSLRWLVTSWRFFLLLIVIGAPAAVLFTLLNAAFTMDFVAQASLLARYARTSTMTRTDELNRSTGRTGCLVGLGQWLFGVRNPKQKEDG
jgi:hypothetical protein